MLPSHVVGHVLIYLSPQDVAFRACLLNQLWYTTSMAHLYKVIPPFPSASQLSRACQTMIAHPEQVAQSVLEISIVHSMRDIDKHTTLYYTVRAALALCTNLEILYLHTDPSVARIMLGACTFRLKTFSIIDPSENLTTVFLSHQESLEELVIVRGASTPLYLPQHALPNLVRFSGIPENAVRISQGRRLRTLRLLPGPTLLNLSDTLSRIDSLTMSSLNEFHVLVTGSVLHHVTALAEFLPCLTALVVRYYQREVLYEALGTVLSTFINLREYSMLSLNMQAPMTQIAFHSELSLVMFYHKKCPTLRAIMLRSIPWVRVEDGDGRWCPCIENPHMETTWCRDSEIALMITKIAEDVLHATNGGLGDDLSGDSVTMDLDNASEGASSIGDQPAFSFL